MVGYMIAKRANHLRVQAAAVSWGERGARFNSISPGTIVTPLALHELNSEIGDGYRAMIAASPSKRVAPPEEIAVSLSRLGQKSVPCHQMSKTNDSIAVALKCSPPLDRLPARAWAKTQTRTGKEGAINRAPTR